MPMFNRGKALNRDFLAGTWRWMLLEGVWVPDIDLDFVSDIAADEASGTGYARQDLAGRAININDTSNEAEHSATNPSWATLTCTDFRYLVLFQFITNDADSPLHSYYDLGAQSVTATTFTALLNGTSPSGIIFKGI